MNKNKLVQIKRRLLALGLAGIMFGTTGCANNQNENEESKSTIISSEYSNIENYYKYVVKNGEAVKLYNSQNVYLLYNKESYDVTEYIYYMKNILGGLGTHVELYDLLSEQMLVYCNGIATTYNREDYRNIVESTYQVCLADASDYVEGHNSKEYYSLDEIRELEPQIRESLKLINKVKTKTK